MKLLGLRRKDAGKDTDAAARCARIKSKDESDMSWQVCFLRGLLRGVVITGISLGLLVGLGWLSSLLPRPQDAQRRMSSASNMKQMGVIFKMYAMEHDEMFPPLTRYDNTWYVDLQAIHPEYDSDPYILLIPGADDELMPSDEYRALFKQETPDWERITRIAARHYVYPGWAVTDEAQAKALAALREDLAPEDYGKDLETENGIIYRLREGVEKHVMPEAETSAASGDPRAKIPVMFENIYMVPKARRREKTRINVLYLDGHVEHHLLSDNIFPATETMAELFCARPE